MENLNTTFGTCRLEATAQIAAPLKWIEGGLREVFAETVLAAVHDHNRHAADGEFVAVDFPQATLRREVAGIAGPVARFAGSHDAVRAVLDSDRMLQFRRRAIRSADQMMSDFTPANEGYCIVRTRRTDKFEPGEIRRRIRRAERKGKCTKNLEDQLEQLEGMSCEERRKLAGARGEFGVFLGGKPLMFERISVDAPEGEARVSTYGASDPLAPVVFDKEMEARKPVAVVRTRRGRTANFLLEDAA